MSNLIDIYSNVEKAVAKAKTLVPKKEERDIGPDEYGRIKNLWRPLHEDMAEENGFTYIGKRTDLSGELVYDACGGFIIEEAEVK